MEEPFKVGSGTGVRVLSAAINRRLSTEPSIVLRCIGAGAVNQAVKAVAKSSKRAVLEKGKTLAVQCRFETLENGVNCVDLSIYLTDVIL